MFQLCAPNLLTSMYDKQTPPSKVLSHCVGVQVCAHIHPLCGLVSILLCTHIVSLCSFSLCFIPVHVCHTSISSAWEISPGNQGMRLPPTICSAQVLRTKVSLQIHVRPIFYTMYQNWCFPVHVFVEYISITRLSPSMFLQLW